jgi:hypothetical protein
MPLSSREPLTFLVIVSAIYIAKTPCACERLIAVVAITDRFQSLPFCSRHSNFQVQRLLVVCHISQIGHRVPPYFV